MSDVLLKYNLLNKNSRKEVDDFIDLLLSKQKGRIKASNSGYKKTITQKLDFSGKHYLLIS